jgi:hypothetical protein
MAASRNPTSARDRPKMADLLQTCRWGGITRVGRPMVHEDPMGTLTNGRSWASNSRVQWISYSIQNIRDN